MSRKNTFVAVCVCSLVCLLSPRLNGQATGSFAGTVSDNSGAVVTGAKVTVTAQTTNISREAMTDTSGHYLVPLLGVADYTIRIEATGFKPAESKDVRLQIDEHRELDFKLVPASVSTSVEVSAAEVAVETTTPALGQVITSEEVAELPLNGRDFVQLATLTPGTTQESNPGSFFNGGPSSEVSARGTYSLSVGGSRAQSTDWLLDGNDNNELTAGGISILPSIDAIQEFKVLTYNYSAEFGTRAGPTVLVTTKSGSNQFHGSVFEFLRNTKLDARSYFAAFREQFNLNQFGFSLGGPIKKDKTFFFIDYQAKQQRHGIPFVGTIPTAAMKTGDFRGDPFVSGLLTNPYAEGGDPANFQCVPGTENAPVPTPEPINSNGGQTAGTPCNYIPPALIDPVGQSLINLYPDASPTFTGGLNYANVPVRKLNEGEFDIRLDHQFSNKDSVFARFSYDQAVSFVPGGSPGFAEQNPFASTQNITNHGRNVMISETHIVNSNNINQVSFGFNRIFNHILSIGTGTCEAAKLGIQGADLGSACSSITGYPGTLNQSTKDCISCGLSSIQMTNYWSLGDRGFAPFLGGTNVWTFSDTFDMIRGHHNIRAGVGIRANQMNVETNGFQDGYFLMFGGYTGDATADLLLGQIGGAIHDQTFQGATTGRHWKMFRPFVQDDWRVTNNLTVNLGLAWALVTPETEVGNRQSNFDIPTLKWYVPNGSPGLTGCTTCVTTDGRVGIQFQKNALEPRIGLSWKPTGSDKTAIRAGYAIFHDSAWNQGGQGLWQNPPYYAEVDPPTFLFGYGSPVGALGGGFLLAPGTPSSTTVDGGFGAVYSSPVNPSTYSGTIQSQNRNFKQGMIQQYTLNIEHQLPGNVVLTAGYAGSKSTHILVSQANENLNQPGACGVVTGYTLGCGFGNFPYAAPFQSVDSNNSVGTARYDGLLIKAETKSTRHGLYALLGYTWSRTFDSGMPDGLGTNPGAIYYPLPGTAKLDWGLSQLNLNDSFTASVLYDLPFGKGKHFGSNWGGAANAVFGNWQLDLIQRITSGFPLFVVDSSNPSGTFFSYNGNTYSRPNQVGDPNKAGPEPGGTNCPTQIHTFKNWFNPCAFQSAPAGEL